MAANHASLDRIDADMVFRAASAPYLVLDAELRIHGANPAYTDATLTTGTELRGQWLFDVFPDNPADPAADGQTNLTASLESVLRRDRRHEMGIQRYDVPDRDDPTRFVHKVWLPTNSPLHDQDGRVVGILHHVEDVTELDMLLDDSLGGVPASDTIGDDPDSDWRARVLRALNELRRAREAALTESRQLRDAITTRAVIEQAKGIWMAQRGCTADEAFRLLVDLSQHANTKVRVLAEALVADTVGQRPFRADIRGERRGTR